MKIYSLKKETFYKFKNTVRTQKLNQLVYKRDLVKSDNNIKKNCHQVRV